MMTKLTQAEAHRFNTIMKFCRGNHGIPEYLQVITHLSRKNLGSLKIYDAILEHNQPFTAADIIALGFNDDRVYIAIKELRGLGLVEQLFKLPVAKGFGPRPNLWGLV